MTQIRRRDIVAMLPLLAVPGQAFARGSAPDFTAIERRSGGRLGLFVLDTATGRAAGWRADDRFPFCSAFKAPLAAFVLSLVERGTLRLDRVVRYTEADLLPYAPITRPGLAQGGLSIEVLCQAAVTHSDNTAANLLLRETGGPRALTAWMRAQGDTAFDLSSNEPGLNLSRYGDRRNTTTPRAMARSLDRIVFGNALRPPSREKLTGWLVANTTGDKRLRAGLPASWRVGDNTGTFNEGWFSTVDVGITWPTDRPPLVIAGFVTDNTDTASGERALADVARAIVAWSR